MTCVPGVTRGAREGQKETACIIGCVMCEQRRKIWVFTCSCTFMLDAAVPSWIMLDAVGGVPCVPPINGRTAGPPLRERRRRPGVVAASFRARDGTGAHRPRAGVKVDEVLGGRRGARRSSEDYRRTAHSVRTGGSAADAHRCYSFRFRGRQVSRRGGRSPCSRQRRARNPHGRWGRRVARDHLVTARPCPRRKPGHQRLSEVVS